MQRAHHQSATDAAAPPARPPASRLGVPDSHIILMLADPVACNPRNAAPGAVYADLPGAGRESLASEGVEVDYAGREVSVDSLLRVLTGGRAAGRAKRAAV